MKELYGSISIEELENMQKVHFKIDKEAFNPMESICPNCNIKMEKIREDRDLFNHKITLHLEKFKCYKCGEEFLSLRQASQYGLFDVFKGFIKNNAVIERIKQVGTNEQLLKVKLYPT